MGGLGIGMRSAPVEAAPRPSPRPTGEATEDTIHLAVVGDLMCHGSQFMDARTPTGFDFRPVFAPVRPYLAGADLAIGNLETVTAGPEAGFTGYPQFNTPVEFLDGIADAGFDVITTANNHSLDRRFLGVERTLEALDARGLKHTGTARTPEERETPLVLEVKGLRLAVLAYTYGTNGIAFPAGKPFVVNLIDTLAMARDIARAREQGAEAIVVALHWGLEYERRPNPAQRRVAEFLARQGVQGILGSHPHVLQPLEWLEGPAGRTVVIYSLGNFVSGQRKPLTDSGLILHLPLIRPRDGGAVRVGEVGFTPTYVARWPHYRVVAVAEAIAALDDPAHPSHLTGQERGRVREVWNETTAHLTDTLAGFRPRQ